MNWDTSGSYTTSIAGGETVRAFLPHLLPPVPPLVLDGHRQRRLEQATLAIGRLDSFSTLLPDPQWFLYAYVRREAVLLSQIEGTQSSLSDPAWPPWSALSTTRMTPRPYSSKRP